jgi:hypothetical protein
VLYAADRVYITDGFDRDLQPNPMRAPLGGPHLGGPHELSFSLFLLFLQEIYSERYRVCRRNPRISTPGRRRKQREERPRPLKIRQAGGRGCTKWISQPISI